ncbi:MAG: hypothetical protein Q8R78_05830 [Candidatus Omnitrophota bacterium]|nr:hypothetical protein [Candidatus Omnitrophota bacterium]
MKTTARPSKCKVRGCKRTDIIFKHGYCNGHYQRWRKTGNPGPATFLPKIYSRERAQDVERALDAPLRKETP